MRDKTDFIWHDGRPPVVSLHVSSSPWRLRFCLCISPAGCFPPAPCRFRQASTIWQTTFLYSLSAPAVLPHHARDIITRKTPFFLCVRRDSPAVSVGSNFAHHIHHFIFRSARSSTGMSFHGQDTLIHLPTCTRWTSVIAGRLLPLFFSACQHLYYGVSNVDSLGNLRLSENSCIHPHSPTILHPTPSLFPPLEKASGSGINKP